MAGTDEGGTGGTTDQPARTAAVSGWDPRPLYRAALSESPQDLDAGLVTLTARVLAAEHAADLAAGQHQFLRPRLVALYALCCNLPESEARPRADRVARLAAFAAEDALEAAATQQAQVSAVLEAAQERNAIAEADAPAPRRRRSSKTELRAVGGRNGGHAATAPAPAPLEPHEEWQAALKTDRNDNLTNDPCNIPVLLSCAPQWAGTLQWSEFTDRVLWAGQPPSVVGMRSPCAGEEFQEHHAIYLQASLAQTYSQCFARGAILDAVPAVAREHPVHEVRQWLDGLAWDGIERQDRWLHAYFGAADTPYTRQVGGWWLTSAVARIYRPGVKVDHALILGTRQQGTGKTTTLEVLGGDWYLGWQVPDLRDKDAMQVLHGAWIVDFGELHGLRGVALTRLKSFLTERVDIYRPSYGRLTVRRPRQCVFGGTTNEAQYSDDPTGARRFWHVEVSRLREDELREDRNQLWAEAVHRFKCGERWWPATADEVAVIDPQQETISHGDEWEAKICDWAGMQSKFRIANVLESCLGLSADKWDRSSQTRVGIILRRLGYSFTQPRDQPGRPRIYSRDAE